MTSHINNVHEAFNRQKKALKLFHTICAAGITSGNLAEVMDSDGFWASVEAQAGTTSTKGKSETRRMVLEMLKNQEKANEGARK